MHEANRIDDGFYTIIQDAQTKRIQLIRFGVQVKEIQPGKILSLDELHDLLIHERAELIALERGEI
jgi:hypothetical protein